MGKRAKTNVLKDETTEVIVSHDGYKKFGVLHERSYSISKKVIQIMDKVTGSIHQSAAHFHFHPSVNRLDVSKVDVYTTLGNLSFSNCSEIVTSKYDYARSFKNVEKSKRISVNFDHSLPTIINIT